MVTKKYWIGSAHLPTDVRGAQRGPFGRSKEGEPLGVLVLGRGFQGEGSGAVKGRVVSEFRQTNIG
jgi:hypothetical protein